MVGSRDHRTQFWKGAIQDHSTKVWLQLAQWFLRRRFLCEFPIGSYVKLSSAVQSSWSEGGTTRHNFGRGPSNDYFIKVWFQLSNWFQTRRFLCEFPVGSYVKLSSAVGTTCLYINIFFNLSLRITNQKKYLSDSSFSCPKKLIKITKTRE